MKQTLILINLVMTILMSILLGCNKKEHTTAWIEVESDSLSTVTQSMPLEDTKLSIIEKKKEYEIQLMASENLNAIETEQKIFLQAGYSTKIIPKICNEKTFYRLRLEKLFTIEEAFLKAKIIEQDFQQIQKVWIQKVL